MRIGGVRSDGAYYLLLGGSFAVILKGDRVSPTLDYPVIEKLGPWKASDNDTDTRLVLNRQLEKARQMPLAHFVLDKSREYAKLLVSVPTALILLADKDDHPFSWCMEHVIPAMEADGKAPDDPEAFCGWYKAEHNLSNPEGINQYSGGGGGGSKEGTHGPKDVMRIAGIVNRAGGMPGTSNRPTNERQAKLAEQMAKSIDTPEKAQARADAAKALGPSYDHMVKPFEDRVAELKHAEVREGRIAERGREIAERTAEQSKATSESAARAEKAAIGNDPAGVNSDRERAAEPKSEMKTADSPRPEPTGPKPGEHGSARMKIVKTEGESLRGEERPLDYGHVNELLKEKYGEERGQKSYERLIDAPGRGTHFVIGTKIQLEKKAMAREIGEKSHINDVKYGDLHNRWMAQQKTKKLSDDSYDWEYISPYADVFGDVLGGGDD